MIVESITKAITFAAPQVALGKATENTESETELAPEVLELIGNFSDRAKSGTVGVVGSLILLVIGIQVLTSIEKSFNTVWGVTKGRKLPERIVTYWTFISLGAVLGTAALSLITANERFRAKSEIYKGFHCNIDGYKFTYALHENSSCRSNLSHWRGSLQSRGWF